MSTPVEQQIRYCTARDGVRIAHATVGSGPPLVKAANWLSHLEFDSRSPVWRHWIRELSRNHTLVRYDERGCGLSARVVDEFSLDAWVRGRWDELDPQPPLSAERLESLAMPPLSEMLAAGREEGLIRFYACSASARMLGLDAAQVQASVEAFLGWQSFSRMIRDSARVVTL